MSRRSGRQGGQGREFRGNKTGIFTAPQTAFSIETSKPSRTPSVSIELRHISPAPSCSIFFTTVPQKGGAYVEFPYDIRKEFGKGRVKVHVTFDGIPYDGPSVSIELRHISPAPSCSIFFTHSIRSSFMSILPPLM